LGFLGVKVENTRGNCRQFGQSILGKANMSLLVIEIIVKEALTNYLQQDLTEMKV
jgi:hypothetical protein